MKSIIEELQKYELIKPGVPFKPLGPVSNIEVQPIREEDGVSEPCEIGEEHYWSVYVRYDPAKNEKQFGGVDCIADCSDFDGARELALLIAGLLGVEVEGV
jgi:hypothetical protein